MKYTFPLTIGAFALLLGSCASERTTFVKGNTIEWQAKNSAAPDNEPVLATAEAIAPETATLPDETTVPVIEASEELTASVDHAVLTAAETHPVRVLSRKDEAVERAVTAPAPQQGAAEAAKSVMVSPAVPPGGSKNQTLAAVLAFFLGGIGVHRFYLGYTWQGIVQILTLGGLGIWALIDFIRICIGDLEPKDGGYD